MKAVKLTPSHRIYGLGAILLVSLGENETSLSMVLREWLIYPDG